jgi:modulator of FtsH protease HflK
MPWNNGGPSPWGNPGGSSGGTGNSSSDGGGSPPPGGPPPRNPWGGGGDNGPGRGRPGGPFGGGGGGGGGPFPDLDRLIAQLQAFIRDLIPGGPKGRFSGGRGLAMLGIVVVGLWTASGFYRVQPDEEGVVLRFGAYTYWTPPGLHWHLPWPIERVELPAVTRINRTEIGFRSGTGGRIESGRDAGGRDVLAESLMLTGDENIIDIDVAVFWRIRDAAAFLFNTRNPQLLVRGVAESSMREVIGRTPIQPALTQLRAQIESDVFHQTQQILDHYDAGVEITQVQLQKVDPPAAVIESFRDVQRANTDAERVRNEAESYRNDIVPRARGDAARITAEAQGAKQASIAQATGQTERFGSVLKAYADAKDLTVRRMYLDTMQDILTHTQTLVIDDKLRGLVPFLPLNLPTGNLPTGNLPTGNLPTGAPAGRPGGDTQAAKPQPKPAAPASGSTGGSQQ